MKTLLAMMLVLLGLFSFRAYAEDCLREEAGEVNTDHFFFSASSDQGARGDIVAIEFSLTLLDPHLEIEAVGAVEAISPEPSSFVLLGCYNSTEFDFVAEAPSEWYEQFAFLPYFFVFPGTEADPEGEFLVSASIYQGAVSRFLASGSPFPLITLYFKVQGEPERSSEIEFCSDVFAGISCEANSLDYDVTQGWPGSLTTRSTLHRPGTVHILPGEATRTEVPDLPPNAKVYDEAPTPETARIHFELTGPLVALPGQEDVRFDLFITSAHEWSGFMASLLFPPEALELERVEEHTRPGLVTFDNTAGGAGILMANSRRRVGAEGERVRVATIVFRVRESAAPGQTVELRFSPWGNFFNWLVIHHREGVSPVVLPVEAEVSPLILAAGLLRLVASAAEPGDVNRDGSVDVSDAVALLDYLFLGGTLRCAEASDFSADGRTDLTDAVSILNALFLGGSRPAGDPVACSGG